MSARTARTPARVPELKPARVARLAGRLLAGTALLAVAVAWVGVERIKAPLMRADLGWMSAALALSAASNLVSAWRWARIAHALGLAMPWTAAIAAYFQAMTINLFVPGATVGGDAYRAVRAHRFGSSIDPAAASVLLDRGTGVWMLALLSLAAGSVAAWTHRLPSDFAFLPWALGLCIVVAAPIAIAVRPFRFARDGSAQGWRHRIERLHALIVERRPVWQRALLDSVYVQALSAAALWACARAVGAASISYWAMLAIAAPIFIAGALPLSIAGFGAREFAALWCAGLVGLDPEIGIGATVIYGMCSVLQGLGAAPAFMLRRTPRRTVR